MSICHRFYGSLGLLVVATTSSAQGFSPQCSLPFDSIKVHQGIDDSCASRGDVASPPGDEQDAAHALQNDAKNNFCQTGTPALVTFASFKGLQTKLDQKEPAAKHWSRDHLPTSRDALTDVHKTTGGALIGEGSVVRFAGWVMKVRKGGAESCNCGGTKKDAIDLHLVLIASSNRENTEECSSVTAEVSPHFRPDKWDSNTILAALAHPLRLTGQLFYDAAHRPCSGNTPGASAPARVSSWEIHPVYGIDVCKKKSLKSCKASDESVWQPLDQFSEGDQ